MKTLKPNMNAHDQISNADHVRKSSRKGAMAMLGYASTFRKTRTTADWMNELREGERP
jgi:hypothetical protein